MMDLAVAHAARWLQNRKRIRACVAWRTVLGSRLPIHLAKDDGKAMAIDSFGDPIYVDKVPEGTTKAGRKSMAPALEAWLAKIEPGKTAMLPSDADDNGHPVSRVTQVRKVAGTAFKIETRTLEAGKRYEIYATVNGTTNKAAGKATAPTAPAGATA